MGIGRLLRACLVTLAFVAAFAPARQAVAQANFDRPGSDYQSAPVTSGDPVWVPLDTSLTKIGGATKTIALLPVVVALSPLLIPMAIAMSDGNCAGEVGREKSLPLRLGDLYAVSKSVRVRALP